MLRSFRHFCHCLCRAVSTQILIIFMEKIFEMTRYLIIRIFCLFTLIVVITNCATSSTNTLVSCSYNQEKNLTDYMVFPYGNVSIPGKWIKTNYNSSSRQQFFNNSDSITIAISFGPCNKYEFNQDNSLRRFEFVKNYYEWDSNYFVKSQGFNRELIEENPENNFVIWRLFGTFRNEPLDNYFLFGENNCMVSNFSILKTNKWSREQKTKFLRNLFLNKN